MAAAGGPAPASDRGPRLFSGEIALTARLAGHASPLPPHAARCVNCHSLAAAGHASVAASAAGLGPALGAATLARDIRRRGGPPSRYDEAAFCRLLASGIDPADIIVTRQMPRYEMSREDCAALWRHLVEARR